MQIEKIDVYQVDLPIPGGGAQVSGGKAPEVAVSTIVALETDTGIVGWGEAISGAPVISVSVAFIVRERLSPLIKGRDPRDVAGAWQAMRDATYWDGNGGIVSFGISAIDMALWDIAGKAAGQPLYAMLGGRQRERVPACASIIFATDDLDRIGREYRGFVEQGYGFVKGDDGKYSYSGATHDDLTLMRKHADPKVQVKAAGGVRTLDDLLAVKALGVTRVGATATVSMLEEANRRFEGGGTNKKIPQDISGY